MKIIKSTGELVEFDTDKIRGTLSRAGATPEMIEHVLGRVMRQVTDKMTTRKLFSLIRRELRKEGKHLSQRYGLRTALLKLGPAGFKFEFYVASILKAYRYNAQVPTHDLTGLCVNHEVDVIARKDNRNIVIEAKFRNKFEDTVKLKDAMATWARFQDLSDGYEANKKCPRFDEIWIVTNGKFTESALQYGLCKGLIMIGWSNGDSLAKLVDHATLYPITVLDDLHRWELDRFAARGLLLCQEIAAGEPAKLAGQVSIPLDRMQKIWVDCQAVVNGK